ncbi:helix-turn-helix domain-containing protein [Dechloromonas denitrificans]|uniref:helix-turn-helix domain-containing protein n=1 Tax=Dechloromonas denitrificans TaxID=281362 RepID=UPI001CF87BC7|nr:helix-turn-helix domain-containing protein [Dechloromonas denitrificans]UCV05570.1 helix-turn-helix domain-containing protein [Dechloromonas denitrificans]UCV09918.1 helix-turn-helix domain-containing protein [Dechloromonas denitrificans]
MPWQSNFILAGLSVTERSLLLDDLKPVSLQAGDVLQNAGELLSHVYFPSDSIVSLLATTHDGASTELAMVGNEGLIGISAVLGDLVSSHKLVVQSAGEAYRLEAGIMRWELAQGGGLQRLALRYTKALLVQMGQNVVCANHHTIEQRLSRWLLLCLDRQPAAAISMTQDRIAGLLGVRREIVTIGAGRLQAAGLIAYQRGKISIIDRAGLEAAACECYGAIRAEYARYFQAMADTSPPSRFRAHPASLRQSALARWRDLPVAAEDPSDSAEAHHELEVRKIELEISNEALHQAFAAAAALSERYADIYDFAPIGYFTLDAAGNILDLNLAGAILLGLKRSQKSRQGFASYLAAESQEPFKQFVAQVLREKQRNLCEIVLAATPVHPAATVRIEAVPDEDGTECRMVLMDITEQRNALEALEHSEMRFRRFIENLPIAKGMTTKPSGKED